MHTDLLARHDGEILDARDVVDAELDEDDEIFACVATCNIVVSCRPGPYARTAAGLVRVPAASIQFAIRVFRDVDILIRELGAFVVVGFGATKHFLEGRGHDLVGDGFAVDFVALVRVNDLEGAICVGGEVEARGMRDEGVLDVVACAVGVEVVVDGHGVGFGVDELVALG